MFNGLLGHEQRTRDLLVGLTGGDEVGDLALTRGELTPPAILCRALRSERHSRAGAAQLACRSVARRERPCRGRLDRGLLQHLDRSAAVAGPEQCAPRDEP